MTTPQWTVDDGMLVFDVVPNEDGDNDCRALISPYYVYDDEAYAALVADVAAARQVPGMRSERDALADEVEHLRRRVLEHREAARLVDDMAAVIRRYEDGWHVVEVERNGEITERYWRSEWQYRDDPHESLSPGEVAALHHARQQEETPCPTCQGDGFIEADEGDPVFDPEDRCADCPTCGGSGEVAALHHARQQEAVVTDTVCPTCGNWYGNHDPECVVATTIHAIWAVSFSPDKATTPPEWNQAIETILADNAHRVSAALNSGPDLGPLRDAIAWLDASPWITDEDTYMRRDVVIVQARALVASTGTETDDQANWLNETCGCGDPHCTHLGRSGTETDDA